MNKYEQHRFTALVGLTGKQVLEAARDRVGRRRSKSKVSNQARALLSARQSKRIESQARNRANEPWFSEHIKKKYAILGNQIAEAMPNSGHSMGCRKSVFAIVGRHKIEIGSDNSSLSSYMGRWKGRENYGYVSVTLTQKELNSITIEGGLVTVVKGPEVDGVAPARWAVKRGDKQHARIDWVSGYLVHGVYHEQYEGLLEGAKAHALGILRIREEARLEKDLRWSALIMLVDARTQVTFSDALNAGNCIPGVTAFCQRVGIDSTKSHAWGLVVERGYTDSQYNRLLNLGRYLRIAQQRKIA